MQGVAGGLGHGCKGWGSATGGCGAAGRAATRRPAWGLLLRRPPPRCPPSRPTASRLAAGRGRHYAQRRAEAAHRHRASDCEGPQGRRWWERGRSGALVAPLAHSCLPTACPASHRRHLPSLPLHHRRCCCWTRRRRRLMRRASAWCRHALVGWGSAVSLGSWPEQHSALPRPRQAPTHPLSTPAHPAHHPHAGRARLADGGPHHRGRGAPPVHCH